MAPVTPVVPVSMEAGAGVESVAERQKKINAACASFIQIGFRPELFTIQNLYDHGYTDKDFLEYIKPLTSPFTDVKELTKVLFVTAKKFWNLPVNASFPNFVEYIEWLKRTEGGRKLMVDTLTRRNLNLESEITFTPADIALVQMMVDYAASRKRVRASIKEDIEELERRQRELEMESASIDADLKTKLGPICGYEGPSIFKVRLEAYKLYEADCKSKGLAVIPKHEMGFEKAMEAFGGIVKDRYLVKYVNDPARRDIIRDFLKHKILRLEYAGAGGRDKCQAEDSFRNLVVAVSDEASAETESTNIFHAFALEDDRSQSGLVTVLRQIDNKSHSEATNWT